MPNFIWNNTVKDIFVNAAAAAKLLSVRLCVTPWTAAHQAPLSLGFSRQEHGSGLPFPSPMHESEKWKWSHSVVSNSQRPHGLQPTRLLHPWDLPGKSTGVGCHCLLRGCAPGYHNKANFSIKWVTWYFWFPNAYTSYVHTIFSLLSVKVLCLKKQCIYLN